MEIEEIRKRNLEALLTERGRGFAKELSDLIGCEPSHLSQIKTDKKNMGSGFARRIEAAIGKPKGWLDTEHVPVTEPVAVSDSDNIKTMIQFLDEYGDILNSLPINELSKLAGVIELTISNKQKG